MKSLNIKSYKIILQRTESDKQKLSVNASKYILQFILNDNITSNFCLSRTFKPIKESLSLNTINIETCVTILLIALLTMIARL